MIRKIFGKKIGLPILSVVGLIFAVYTVLLARRVEPLLPPLVAPPRNPFPTTIAGSGVIEPANERATSIGAPEPGIVSAVLVKVGDVVKRGAPLFQLDDRSLQAEKKVREAALRSSRAKLSRMEAMPRPEEVPPLQAAVEQARANLREFEGQLERLEKASQASQGVVSQDVIDTRRWQVAAARNALARAEADLALKKAGAWEFDVREARGDVDRAEAALAQTATEIERYLVRAPGDGTILQVNVRDGEYTAASTQSLVVFGDTSTLHVRVDVDEESAPLVREGQTAVAMLRGLPGRSIPLEFVRIEPYVSPKKTLTGDNNERVDTRVLQVIFKLGKTDLRAYVGQQVDVFIEKGPQTLAAGAPPGAGAASQSPQPESGR